MKQLIERLGGVGGNSDGGVTRLLYCEAWVAAADLVQGLMGAAGLETRRDEVGNVFGRLPGTDPSAGVVLTGSHLDTVRSGGRFDGALGIVGGIAALAALRREGVRTRRSLEVVALCEEEGSRFKGSLFGSRAILGLVEEHEPDAMWDRQGTNLSEAMREVGLDPKLVSNARRNDVECFVELHIEQGPTLHEAGIDCGIVTDITGLSQRLFTVVGQADHAGAMPMDRRRDALAAAASMISRVATIASEAGHPVVGTVGELTVDPGSANTIPQMVRFTLDLRHPHDRVRADILSSIVQECQHIAISGGLSLEVSELWEQPGSPMDSALQDILADTASTGGLTRQAILSGAAHDSQLWARHVPTAMLFVPSVNGRSHCAPEYTSPEDCAQGATVLARALAEIA